MNELEQEFTRMVREQKSTIYTVCLMFSDDRGEVDDMVQETLVNLWRGFEKFRKEANERIAVLLGIPLGVLWCVWYVLNLSELPVLSHID